MHCPILIPLLVARFSFIKRRRGLAFRGQWLDPPDCKLIARGEPRIAECSEENLRAVADLFFNLTSLLLRLLMQLFSYFSKSTWSDDWFLQIMNASISVFFSLFLICLYFNSLELFLQDQRVVYSFGQTKVDFLCINCMRVSSSILGF